MKTNISLSLDTRRIKKDDTYPLVFRLSHQRKTIAIPSGFSISSSDWNVKSRTVKKSYKGVSSVVRLNNLLAKKKTHFIDQINKLEESQRLVYMSIKQLKEYLCKTSSSVSFFEYTQKIIDEFNKAKRIGNKKIYKCVYQFVKRFHPYEHLRFEEINYAFLKELEAFHYSKGNTVNGLAVYMRVIRALYNKAIKEGIVRRDAYPFAEYKIKSEPTEKRAINREKIQRILHLELKKGDVLFNTRNFFLASYLMNGMSFIDMAYLKKENIIDGRIRYRRKKTAKLYDLKVTEQLSMVLSSYLKGKKKSDFIFPIIKRKDIEDQYRDITRQLALYNKALKEIAEKCEIEEHLTSYVSRHSMATHLILSDVPINALSKMLGHSKLSTTEIYIKQLPTHVLDEYQEKLSL